MLLLLLIRLVIIIIIVVKFIALWVANDARERERVVRGVLMPLCKVYQVGEGSVN